MNDIALVKELILYEKMWYEATNAENKEAKWSYLVEVTSCLPSHPEGYYGPCFCEDCKLDWLDA